MVDYKLLELPWSKSSGGDFLPTQRIQFVLLVLASSIHSELKSYGTHLNSCVLLHFCSQHGGDISSSRRSHAHTFYCSNLGSYKQTQS